MTEGPISRCYDLVLKPCVDHHCKLFLLLFLSISSLEHSKTDIFLGFFKILFRCQFFIKESYCFQISIDSPTRGLVPTSLSPEQEASSLVSEQVFLAPVVVPRWEIVAPIFPENAGDYSRDTGDMDVAEDIIFRPLFRYRQELQEKSRYANRRRGYRPYRDYDYPRRGYYYRSRYDDY